MSKKVTVKKGAVVVPTHYVAGSPIGLTTGTRCVVREVSKEGRVRVERDDGRPGSWWLDTTSVRVFGA